MSDIAAANPLTDDTFADSGPTEQDVWDYLWALVTMTDEELDADEGESPLGYPITREEAAQRIADQDFSVE